MGRTLTATKLQWFDKFGLGLKRDANTGAPLPGEQTVGIDSAGDYWNVPVHLTLYRTTWKYKFQPHHDTSAIFDRIFGRGSTGVHVTLETVQQPEPHCYFGGPNFGRSDAEKKLLEEILEFYVNRFSQTIRSLGRDTHLSNFRNRTTRWTGSWSIRATASRKWPAWLP